MVIAAIGVAIAADAIALGDAAQCPGWHWRWQKDLGADFTQENLR
jgi:hypothetical protein